MSRETYDFRLFEKEARACLPPGAGRVLSSVARQVQVTRDDPLYGRIRDADRDLRREGGALVASWQVHREYTPRELSSAQLLHMVIRNAFEPAGEECGTLYDPVAECVCGAESRQVSPLRIDPAAVPQRSDVAWTIAHEIVLRSAAVEVFGVEWVTGSALAPVEDCQHRPVDALRQLVATASVRAAARTEWSTLPPGFLDQPVETCPNGHPVGRTPTSEFLIERNSWDGQDVVATQQWIGVRRGLIRPYRAVLLSQRLYKLLRSSRITGIAFEVAHLV